MYAHYEGGEWYVSVNYMYMNLISASLYLAVGTYGRIYYFLRTMIHPCERQSYLLYCFHQITSHSIFQELYWKNKVSDQRFIIGLLEDCYV